MFSSDGGGVIVSVFPSVILVAVVGVGHVHYCCVILLRFVTSPVVSSSSDYKARKTLSLIKTKETNPRKTYQ
jgi:hypothetical protein